MDPLKMILACCAAALSALASTPAQSGGATNVKMVEQGDTYEVSYDLEGDNPVPVALLGSSDGGKTFDLLMERVNGDVGDRVAPGRGKRITWNIRKEFPRGLPSQDFVVDVVIGRTLADLKGPMQPVKSDAQYLSEIVEDRRDAEEKIREFEKELSELKLEEGRLRGKIATLERELDSLTIEKRVDYRKSGDPKKITRAVSHNDVELAKKKIKEKDRAVSDLATNMNRQDSVTLYIGQRKVELEELDDEERIVRKNMGLPRPGTTGDTAIPPTLTNRLPPALTVGGD